MKYKVTYVYSGRVTVEVEAPSEEAAEREALAEADEMVHHNLSIEHVRVREV